MPRKQALLTNSLMMEFARERERFRFSAIRSPKDRRDGSRAILTKYGSLATHAAQRVEMRRRIRQFRVPGWHVCAGQRDDSGRLYSESRVGQDPFCPPNLSPMTCRDAILRNAASIIARLRFSIHPRISYQALYIFSDSEERTAKVREAPDLLLAMSFERLRRLRTYAKHIIPNPLFSRYEADTRDSGICFVSTDGVNAATVAVMLVRLAVIAEFRQRTFTFEPLPDGIIRMAIKAADRFLTIYSIHMNIPKEDQNDMFSAQTHYHQAWLRMGQQSGRLRALRAIKEWVVRHPTRGHGTRD